MAEVKEGAKTSENAVSKGALWIAVLVAILSVVGGLAQQWDNAWASVIGLGCSAIGAALVALGYTAGRVLIKHQALKSSVAKPDWGEIVDLLMDAISAAKEEKTDAKGGGDVAGGDGAGAADVGGAGGVS